MRNLSRRSIMGGAAALPFITAAPAFAALGVDRSTWNAALADAIAADAAARRADDAYSVAFDTCAAELPPQPPLSFNVPCDEGESGAVFPMRYASEAQLRAPVTADAMRWLHEQAQAALVPQWDAYNRTRAEISQRLNMDALADECDQAGNAACRAHNRLMETPAPDAAALAIKLERLWGDTLDWGDPCDEHKRAVIDDAKRLAGREGYNA